MANVKDALREPDSAKLEEWRRAQLEHDPRKTFENEYNNIPSRHIEALMREHQRDLERMEREAARQLTYAAIGSDRLPNWFSQPISFPMQVSVDPAETEMSKLEKELLNVVLENEPDRKAIPRLGVQLLDEEESDVKLAREAEALLGYSVLRKKLNLPGKLGKILSALEIEPLDTKAVDGYKEAMVLWRKKELLGELRKNPRLRIEVSWRQVVLKDYNKKGTEIPMFALRKAVQVKKACPEVVLQVHELVENRRVVDPFLAASFEDEHYYLDVWGEPKFEATL